MIIAVVVIVLIAYCVMNRREGFRGLLPFGSVDTVYLASVIQKPADYKSTVDVAKLNMYNQPTCQLDSSSGCRLYHDYSGLVPYGGRPYGFTECGYTEWTGVGRNSDQTSLQPAGMY